MSKTLEFFFDVGSPASYLAFTQLPALADRHGAELIWKPMLLGGVFKATGNQPPGLIRAKGIYMTRDFDRYADDYGVPFKLNPYFPANTLMVMRGAVAYQDTPRFMDYLNAVFTAMWVDGKNMNELAEVGQALSEAGFDPQEVMALCGEERVKEKLKAYTDEAVERGVFGAPTFFIGDEMFFGQDRLVVMEKWLAK